MAALFSFQIIVLAAGQSSRMRGRDKLLEDVDGMPLLRRQASLARGATTGMVIIALPPAPHPRYTVLDGLNATTLPIPDASEGMNASLRHAFAHLPANANCAMLMLGDLPELTADDLARVAAAVDLDSDTLIWRGATAAGQPGHPIVFRSDLFGAFADLTGDGGGKEVVASANGKIALIALPDNHARQDLDTPEEWNAWRKNRKTT